MPCQCQQVDCSQIVFSVALVPDPLLLEGQAQGPSHGWPEAGSQLAVDIFLKLSAQNILLQLLICLVNKLIVHR